MNETTLPENLDAEGRPFLESIKRLGHQARHWETTTDFGANLDILAPSNRRRLVVSPRLLLGAVALLMALLILQTVFVLRELRAQRATIEQLSSLLGKTLGQPAAKKR